IRPRTRPSRTNISPIRATSGLKDSLSLFNGDIRSFSIRAIPQDKQEPTDLLRSVGSACSSNRRLLQVAVLAAHVHEQVNNAVAVAPLVVVPAHELEEALLALEVVLERR